LRDAHAKNHYLAIRWLAGRRGVRPTSCGHYQGIDIQGANAVMVWGEGVSYTGGPENPGHLIYRTMAI